MRYNIEELIPIVAKLAQGYTSKESTSISYEKAQQLMEAVIYCIHEGERDIFLPVSKTDLAAEKMYEIGVKCVEEKTRKTLAQYNDLMTHFLSYEKHNKIGNTSFSSCFSHQK